jgi:hypothetical protein
MVGRRGSYPEVGRIASPTEPRTARQGNASAQSDQLQRRTSLIALAVPDADPPPGPTRRSLADRRHNSPSLVQNPVQTTNIIVVDRVDRPDYTATVHVSNDGGNLWRDTPLVLPAATPRSKFFASSAAFDAKGILYVSFVTLSGSGQQPRQLLDRTVG